MFVLLSRFVPSPFRLLVLLSCFALFAVVTSAGSLAAKDPTAGIPDSAEPRLAEICDDAADTFFRENDWIMSHDSDHPRMDQHADAMWHAWYIAEVMCRTDVGGNGEPG